MELQNRLMNAHPNMFGKGVEFIPYQLSSIWSKEEYLNLFHQKNQYINKVGTIAFQGVAEWEMEEILTMDQTLHQF